MAGRPVKHTQEGSYYSYIEITLPCGDKRVLDVGGRTLWAAHARAEEALERQGWAEQYPTEVKRMWYAKNSPILKGLMLRVRSEENNNFFGKKERTA